ncbi:hypothetical protein EDB92DRAFT_1402578 [Lactarius akahatsu]|uniref:Uncharacterized protein n=1 Tax=Lactarius akahatsu TaxID=416441 RepID=A0AAD4LNM7_9AGAM|nr:hypothetical protein EDB92DRAFT_1402578 [Lactarius akahatsu]
MEHSVSFVPQLSPQETVPKVLIEDEEMTDYDIYRGVQYPTSQALGSESASSQSPSFTASSTSFRLAGGRLGAIATRLERAIARWARANWADSSSSLNSETSTDSSRSSFRTTNKSTRRRRRRSSVADIQQRMLSERTVAARLRAREARRTVPREFNLYSPSENDPSLDPAPLEEVVRTFSLDQMLPHLEILLRRHGKPRRPRHRGRAMVHELGYPHQSHPHQERAPRNGAGEASRADAADGVPHKLEKGKDKMPAPRHPSMPLREPGAGKPPPAWWLDVANPSWEDMKSLGRLLHLHPLTLEDILQREPREKFELFPKLGYYFIVFRALESSTAPERLDAISQKTGSSQPQDHGVVNEINVYLVVFRGGICSFHFSNISDHLDRVRGKLQTTAQTARKSSAWIAHGILDSIVDSFFPFVEEIEKEVMAIESVVYNEDSPGSTVTAPSISLAHARASRLLTSEEKALPLDPHADEKHLFFRDVASIRTAKTQFSLPRLTFGLMLRRMRRAFFRFVGLFRPSGSKPRNVEPSFSRASFDLRRMARTRRLVTSVARVLATKPEVVAGIGKRLMTADGLVTGDDAEVGIYLGDVQDHILTLQQSLAHYERMLSQSHPTYLLNLRVDMLRARAKGDYAAFILALISVVVLPPMVPIGALSMNVKLPRNNDEQYWLFGIVVVVTLCIQASFVGLFRYWWVTAKRRHGRAL